MVASSYGPVYGALLDAGRHLYIIDTINVREYAYSLAREPLGDAIDVEWKSFLLRVEPKTGDRERFVEYTRSWLRPAELEPAARFRVWASDDPQPSSSVPAQVAHKVLAARWPERAMDYHRRLLEAYFWENRDISDGEILVELAEQIGVDPVEFREAAAELTEEMTARVIEEHNSAVEHEVTAVPTVVFAGVFPIPGAQPVETYERIVEKIAEHRSN